ncbi:MAG: DEAD/DEAH box helicase [Thaumarchaeota archaeon]|nr:DEAD/DEAH box helicase [Nitrososphaerota archaeon]
MQDFDSRSYAIELTKYLCSRFHPELPHIGTIGTADVGYFDDEYDNEEKEIEEGVTEEEKTSSKDSSSTKPSQELSSFKFVPFSASYKLNLNDQKDNLTTKFSFYLRTDEGSWHDLKGEDNPGFQQHDPDVARENEFWLTKEELSKSFRKFDLAIESNLKTKEHVVTLKVDEKQIDSPGKDKLKESVSEIENGTRIQVELFDKSEPFIVRFGKNYDIVQQKYDIVFEKSLEVLPDGKVIINVEITNKSPFTQTSDLPQIELKSENQYETKEETIERYRDEVFTKSNQEKELYSQWNPKLFKKKDAYWSARGSLYGHLLEFSVIEEGINSSNDPYENESDVEQVINLVYDEYLENQNDRFKGKIIYKNHVIFDEQIPPMALGGKLSDTAKKVGMSQDLSKILSKRYPELYKFQYDTVQAINSSLGKDMDSGVLISTRTGGGKTEAFLFPIIDYCLSRKDAGTKAIIFYPTKALANDQASRIISLLYRVNQHLKSSGNPRRITIGLCHGDVPKHDKDLNWQMYWQGIPLRCPVCPNGYLTAVEHTKVQCTECQEELDFVLLFQEPNFGILPDIFITNPDKIQWDMIERPDHHGIFGREITCCTNCYHGFAKLGKRKCDACSKTQFERKKPLPPRFIVFDEIHQFKGTFGANTLYLHERLRFLFKKYAKANHDLEWKVCSIGSSATIANADTFSEKFFGLDSKDIIIIPKDPETGKSYYGNVEKSYNRTHLFIMPYRYRPAATCSKVVGYLQARRIDGVKPEPFSKINSETGEPLQTLGFTNSIQDIGQLVNICGRERRYSIPVSVDGHSTDYDHEQRAGVERKFNRKELNVIFATPTLEVGVDFETVNVVLIFGFPFSFNDYVQRIGRGGRGENTLVVTICHNYKPIDHFFYVDARKKISQQHLSIEPIPVTRDNPEVIKQHLVASLLDQISSLDDAPDLWENVKDNLLAELESRGKDMYDTKKEFAPINTFRLPENEKSDYQNFLKGIIEEQITRLKGFIQRVTTYEYLHGKNSVDDKYRITKLRSIENEVKVEMIWEIYES